MFCEHIGRILAPWNLIEGEILFPNAVLNPQVSSGQVSDFAKSAPPSDANGSGGICHDGYIKFDAQIGRQGLQSKRLRRTFADPCQFSLCR